MSFSASDLSVLAYANGFTHWHYRTRDGLADLLSGPRPYFAAAGELLRAGDQITATLIGAGRVDLASLAVIAMGDTTGDTTSGPNLALLASSVPDNNVFRRAA